jgi:hypothetical protein
MPQYIVRASRAGVTQREDVFESPTMEDALTAGKEAWKDLDSPSWTVWQGADYPDTVARLVARGYARWGDAIVGRMVAENAADLSDAEIERTLGPCVCGPRLIVAAKAMRDAGTLTPASLDAERGR